MISRASLERFVLKTWGNQYFLILFIVNILSNGTAFDTFGDVMTAIAILCISALSATVESCFCRLFSKESVRKTILWILVAFHLILAIVDFFLLINFHKILTLDILCIIAETTQIEAQSFLSTYLDFKIVLSIVIAFALLLFFAIWVSRKMAKNRAIALVSMILSLLGVGTYASVISGHTFNSDGVAAISQLHSFTRLARAGVGFRNSINEMIALRGINTGLTASLKNDVTPSIVVIIGESFTKYHSSLYGYSKQTNPLLSERVKDGSLSVFDDVVSVSDHTGVVMFSVFSVNGSKEPNSTSVLFPVFFKAAGFKTALLDNQYFVGNGYSWITDGTISDIMFDFRNEDKVGYDEELVAEIPNFTDPQLIVIHLFGQHYTYADRYPSEFKHFTAADYSKDLSEDEREIIAHYDNATIYNDYVVESVIRKYQDKNCMVVYFSDHGEELYEIDDFMGHGNAAERPTVEYQLRVPFMVWTSSEFQSKYPDVVKRIKESVHKPILTDYVAHFLFEVAGIDTKYYCPELSFINDNYPEDISRIVLGNMDFDNRDKSVTIKTRY